MLFNALLRLNYLVISHTPGSLGFSLYLSILKITTICTKYYWLRAQGVFRFLDIRFRVLHERRTLLLLSVTADMLKFH